MLAELVGDFQAVVVANGHYGMAAFQALAGRGEWNAAVGFGLLYGIIDRKAKDKGKTLGEIGFQAVEDFIGPGAGRVVAEVFYRLEVLGKGIAKGGRLAVEGAVVVGIGPVGFGWNAKEHHGPHGGAEVGAGVAAELHQVAGRFVEEKPRGVKMPTEGPALVVFYEANSGMSRAGAEGPLVFHRRTEFAEVDGGRERGGVGAAAEGREVYGFSQARPFPDFTLQPIFAVQDVADLGRPFVIIAEVGTVGQPAHSAPETGWRHKDSRVGISGVAINSFRTGRFFSGGQQIRFLIFFCFLGFHHKIKSPFPWLLTKGSPEEKCLKYFPVFIFAAS